MKPDLTDRQRELIREANERAWEWVGAVVVLVVLALLALL